MKMQSFSFHASDGWAFPSNPGSGFPDLDSPQTVVMVFGGADFLDAPGPLAELAHAYPRSVLIGCSTAGEIAGRRVEDGSLSVAAIRFERSAVATVSVDIAKDEDMFSLSAKLASRLIRPDLRGIFVLSDGLMVNGSELIKGVNSVLPPGVVVTGGLAGDGDRFRRTWVMRNGVPATGVISATGFYGADLDMTHGSRGGWDPFGPERRITRSSGNVLYELDGSPALALYKEYLGHRAAELPAAGLLFPLSIRRDTTDTRHLVRTILAVDDATLSLRFAGDVPTGYLAQLMKANFDRLIRGAGDAAAMARGTNAGPLLAVLISCVGRRLVLGQRCEEEVELALKQLPSGSCQLGFYSYGEISPYASGTCDLHNQTMTVTTFSER